jgi:hypothetical protein
MEHWVTEQGYSLLEVWPYLIALRAEKINILQHL